MSTPGPEIAPTIWDELRQFLPILLALLGAIAGSLLARAMAGTRPR